MLSLFQHWNYLAKIKKQSLHPGCEIAKHSSTNCRWVCLTILWGCRLKGETKWSNHFVFNHSQDLHVVKLYWQTMLFLFILYFYADFLLIQFWLKRLAITHKRELLSYWFRCKRSKNNSRENIVRNLSIYKRHTLSRNIFITFFCVKFLLFSVSNLSISNKEYFFTLLFAQVRIKVF